MLVHGASRRVGFELAAGSPVRLEAGVVVVTASSSSTPYPAYWEPTMPGFPQKGNPGEAAARAASTLSPAEYGLESGLSPHGALCCMTLPQSGSTA
jgi:hypothetical protein